MAAVVTMFGLMEEHLLDKREGHFENGNEITHWVEYRLKGKEEPVVHRSVYIQLKQGLEIIPSIGGI